MAEPLPTKAFTAEFITSLSSVTAEAWNQLAGPDYPFLRHEFLYGLEQTGCTTGETGWQPCHLLLRQGDQLCAIMPLYLKSHSYGEYVFDWSWADAWRQSGLQYYPKLVTAVPFTPATGPRICVASDSEFDACVSAAIQAVQSLAIERDISSWHLLFPEKQLCDSLVQAGMPRRASTQFHWFNDGYQSFDDFLGTFNSRKRKALKRERKRVREQDLILETLTGDEIGEAHWQQFYRFYQDTYAKRSGHGGYLTRDFFLNTAANMGDQVVMVLAHQHGTPVAGALYFKGNNVLYGRYWGCVADFDCLHFEACYYQGIEYCIANGLAKFDPGAQGEHKIQRGFRPTTTWSNHWIADQRLAAAVADFTEREAQHNTSYLQATESLLPFRQQDDAG